MNPKYLNDDDPWMLAEEIPNCDLFFSNIWLKGFVSNFKEHTGRSYRKIACHYRGYRLWFYFDEKDSYEVGELIAEKMVTDPSYGEKINENIIIESDKLRRFSETIPQENLDQLSNETLWNIYKEHLRIHSEYYTWGWIPVGADMFHNNLTTRVKKYLRSLGVGEDRINEHLVTITQPTEKSLIFIEQEDLLKIAIEIEKDDALKRAFLTQKPVEIRGILSRDIGQMIKDHRAKYYYTKHLWVSGEYTVEDYIGQIKEIFETGIPALRILKDQSKKLAEAKEKKERLIYELHIDEYWQIVLKSYGDYMTTKIYRRYAQLLAVHHMSAILKEIARRGYITEKQVRFMQAHEVENFLLHDTLDEAQLLARTAECVLYAEKDYDKVYVGKEARPLLEAFQKQIDTNVTELRGDTGCPGYAMGKVKIIIRAEEMGKINYGDILVSIATDPDIVPAMKKAAAIVTEQGGVTSHAAIVSRELGIPCVIGTKIATKVFKDGDLVEVDATKGVVRKL